MSKLLFDKRPLVFDVDLAIAAGQEQSIIIQQIHYWLEEHKDKREHTRDGRTWTYNTIQGWHRNFPFWGEDKIKKLLLGLESSGLILSRSDLNRFAYDRTKWYSIDYQRLDEIVAAAFFVGPPRPKHSQLPEITHSAKWHDGKCQTAPSNVPNGTMERADQHDQYHETIHETIQKTTTPIESSGHQAEPSESLRVPLYHPELFTRCWKGMENDLAAVVDQFGPEVYTVADQIDHQKFVQPYKTNRINSPLGLLLSHFRGMLKYTPWAGYTTEWREQVAVRQNSGTGAISVLISDENDELERQYQFAAGKIYDLSDEDQNFVTTEIKKAVESGEDRRLATVRIIEEISSRL